MTLKIQTQRGTLKYKFQVIYEGVKVLDKTIAKENLLLFKQIADKAGLRFGLAYGTLLGAIREHDFIAHDEDTDLFIMKEDIEAFKNMLWDLLDAGFSIMRFDRRNSLCSITRKGEYIDIYIFKDICEGICEINGECTMKKFLTNLKEIPFQGAMFMGPAEAEDYCLLEYGENWSTPIAMKPYDMGWYQKKKSQLYWLLHYSMPDFLFRRYARKKAYEKIRIFNQKVERYNRLAGKEVCPKVDERDYTID